MTGNEGSKRCRYMQYPEIFIKTEDWGEQMAVVYL